jgi:hypothetical protein
LTLVTATSTIALAESREPVIAEDPPRNAGAESGVTRNGGVADAYGTEIAGFAGVGYGVGIGGRLGYTFPNPVYVGGAFTYYDGNASFLGAEVGYKLFATPRWELRPYAFLGPAFVREGRTGFGRSEPDTVVAFQPGFLGAYHFGPIYLSAEMRAYVAPNPGALAFLGGVGAAL